MDEELLCLLVFLHGKKKTQPPPHLKILYLCLPLLQSCLVARGILESVMCLLPQWECCDEQDSQPLGFEPLKLLFPPHLSGGQKPA